MPRKVRNPSAETNKKPLQPRAASADAEWAGYINLKLTDEEKTEAKQLIDDQLNTFIQGVSDDVWDGFKLSVVADVLNECYIATLTGTPYEGSKFRCSLSARGGDILTALALLHYKHANVLSKNWGSITPNGNRTESFG